MKQLIQDNLEFFKQFRRQFYTTGAVLPSSRFLARAMIDPLRQHNHPRRVLEIGPGTGAVTRHVVRHLKSGDHFDLVEINERFANLLKERFGSDPRFQPAAPLSQVHVCPLQEFECTQEYDIILCGLPFNNFNSQLVEELLDSAFNLLAPGGSFSFFEYMYVRPVRRAISKGPERERLTQIEQIMQNRFRNHRYRTNWVFVNVPPAWVQHLRKPELADVQALDGQPLRG